MKFLNRYSLMFFLFFSVSFLSACSTFHGPREVLVSTAQLQSAVAKKFPIQKKYLDVIELNLSAPTLNIVQQDAVPRLSGLFPFQVNNTPFGNVTGRARLSGTLRYDAAQNAVLLEALKLDNFDLDGVANRLVPQLAQVFYRALSDNLQTIALYQVRDEDLKFMGAIYTPQRLTLQENGVKILLMPKP